MSGKPSRKYDLKSSPSLVNVKNLRHLIPDVLMIKEPCNVTEQDIMLVSWNYMYYVEEKRFCLLQLNQLIFYYKLLLTRP